MSHSTRLLKDFFPKLNWLCEVRWAAVPTAFPQSWYALFAHSGMTALRLRFQQRGSECFAVSPELWSRVRMFVFGLTYILRLYPKVIPLTLKVGPHKFPFRIFNWVRKNVFGLVLRTSVLIGWLGGSAMLLNPTKRCLREHFEEIAGDCLPAESWDTGRMPPKR